MENDAAALLRMGRGKGELLTVKGAHWDAEMGSMTQMLTEKSNNSAPAILFDEVPGYAKGFRTLYGHFSTIKRVALTLGLPLGILAAARRNTWLDYLASMNMDWAYALSVEKMLGIKVPERVEYIRVIMAELQRIASHLIALGTYYYLLPRVCRRELHSQLSDHETKMQSVTASIAYSKKVPDGGCDAVSLMVGEEVTKFSGW